MAKNIVLCSDGTGNRDIKARGTNVFKLYEAVDIQGHKGAADVMKQVAFYDDGVGTANAFARVVGGAFGWGFSNNVKKMYRELVNVYEPGDKIFLFGFSRGAYTVRALAGFIQYCGVLDSSYYNAQPRDLLTEKIGESWDEFRTVAFRQKDADDRKRTIPSQEHIAAEWEVAKRRRREKHAVNPEECIDIAFIGVWDTVGAIGTPFDGLRDFIGRFIWPIWFADNTLGPEVAQACQALALDEERRTFHPELWNEKNGADTRIKQVWFSGVHSNVGGGYPKQGMSLVTLDWMMNEASRAGLCFIQKDLDFVREHQDVHDKMYDSRAGVAVYYRWSPRDLRKLCDEHNIPIPKLHVSIFERIANGTAGVNGADTYSPGNIPFKFEMDTGGSIDWPGTSISTQIPTLVQSHYSGSKSSLLAEMDKEVRSGVGSYMAFLAVTGLTLLLLVVRGVRSLCGYMNCIDVLLVLGAAVVFVLGSIIAHSWAVKVDCALCCKYTGFWHKCRRPLRMLLP
ncbi:protein of unknown function, DUF2235-containing [Geotalea daltonii FRC-32]|uniref:T6SS Phospholipase effector Tle1-like catalytic domain-containing protein n=1 Tax=Geotalea daltonii (strain DSM 22248 / JCM 15807 / FRC-32) TaxID=316067 RepID=B9M477_GEODF|nr:DUF2235 domain-containing protein [Geotalea daltonii]ACM21532.1 protein of unknown function, DUF2235-containing [Geotalea daltonii FRC-32]